MKKIFRKLACYSFLSIASIGCFEVDARLPEYMAQKAAELLIEESGLVLATTPEEFAKDLVDLLYSTKKRQQLADWFKGAYNNASRSYNAIEVSNASDDIQKIIKKIGYIDKNTKGVEYFNNATFFHGDVVNQHFPCWTGTLTCFLLDKENIANQMLFLPARQRKQDAYWQYKKTRQTAEYKKIQITINVKNANAQEKFIHVLFLLELIDTWGDVKKIIGREVDEPTKDEDYDPYNCVPVPNTAYKTTFSTEIFNTQGSCMVSTIRNLLYILCRTSQESRQIVTNQNWQADIQTAFSKEIYTVPGTTSCETLGEFAKIILPNITELYQPTLELFVCTLNSLLCENMRENVVIPTPEQYISGALGISETVIGNILRKLTGHQRLTATFNNSNFNKFKGWPEQRLIITDENVNKEITIAFGQIGTGKHIEIIDIKPANRPR